MISIMEVVTFMIALIGFAVGFGLHGLIQVLQL